VAAAVGGVVEQIHICSDVGTFQVVKALHAANSNR